MTTSPTRIVYGQRSAMVAEYAAIDPTTIGVPAAKCKWLVLPLGDDQWDAEWHPSLKAAQADARAIAKQYGIPVETI